jgi:hypothetical protein
VASTAADANKSGSWGVWNPRPGRRSRGGGEIPCCPLFLRSDGAESSMAFWPRRPQLAVAWRVSVSQSQCTLNGDVGGRGKAARRTLGYAG